MNPDQTPNAISQAIQQDVVEMVSAVKAFIDETALLYSPYENKPAIGSKAEREQSAPPFHDLAKDTHYSGILSLESAADHLMLFADAFVAPAKTLAPWTCARGLLESCALAHWFLDPTIDARTRVQRSFAFRYLGFVEQGKLFTATKDVANVAFVQQRMTKAEKDALALGYAPVTNKKGRVDAFGMRMPSITTLIETTLGNESEYRLLSAIAHGHHWATQQVGFEVTEIETAPGQVTIALEKSVLPNFVLFVAAIAVTSYTRALYQLWRLYSWDKPEIESHFEKTYDKLRYTDALRFWRTTGGKP